MASDKHRVALVTGGMGGLGEAICIKLAALGYTVVTTYSPGNTKAAEWLAAMKGRDYNVPRVSVRRRRLGVRGRLREEGHGGSRPGRGAGQQRRHHARHDVQEDGQGQLGRGDEDQPRLVLQHDEAGLRRDGRPRLGPHHQHLVGQRPEGRVRPDQLLGGQGGMHGFTKALALEFARKGVTVNTISPGYIGTKMVMAIPKEVLDSKIIPQIPMGRLGKPEEVAGLVAYLCERGSGVRDRRQHRDQRRPAHVLTRLVTLPAPCRQVDRD